MEKRGVAFFLPPDPIRPQGYQDELRAVRPENDPERPPHREPGDGFILALAVVGILLGGCLGFVISRGIGGIIIAVLCILGGVLIGGTGGAFVGEKIKDHFAASRAKKREGQ